MLVLVFIAVIIMTGGGYGVGSYRNVNWNWVDHNKTMIQASRAYNVSPVILFFPILSFLVINNRNFLKMCTNLRTPQVQKYRMI